LIKTVKAGAFAVGPAASCPIAAGSSVLMTRDGTIVKFIKSDLSIAENTPERNLSI